jgi:hypothetical protein
MSAALMPRSKKTQEKIPQVLALTKVSLDGRVALKKKVQQYLRLGGQRSLYLDKRKEITISSQKRTTAETVAVERNGIRLPRDVIERLGINRGEHVGFVERNGALAVKALEVTEVDGREARWVDIETPYKITRRIETNPLPERFLARVSRRHRGLKLKYDVRSYFENGRSMEALRARRILGSPHASDGTLKRELIRERSEQQAEDGSWNSSVTVTARTLKELAELGLSPRNAVIRRAVDWLVARPESPYNPGLWFAYDELVSEQADVIELRKRHAGKGPRPRFNRSNAREVNLVRAGDPVIVDPCGPRIMWTSALVLEALLSLGLEREKRVQTALRTLSIEPNWCDNNYQHGLSAWKRTEPFPPAVLDTVEKYAVQFYRYGGIRSLQALLGPESVTSYGRVANAAGDTFVLNMPFGVGEGCKIIMTRALTRATDPALRKLVTIRLWEFAAVLNLNEERTAGLAGHDVTDRAVFFLQIFSRSDQPVAKLALARMLPWLVNAQNGDGSWGRGQGKDATSHAVVDALVSLGEHLPAGFLQGNRR